MTCARLLHSSGIPLAAPPFGNGASHNRSGAPGFQASERSVGVRADFLVPALEQFLALGRFAIGLEVIINEFDILKARRFLWNFSRLVRWQLEGLRILHVRLH